MSKPKTPAEKLMSSYVIGFVLSVVLTLIAYFTVINKTFGQDTLGVIMILATLQFVVQVVFFLHMGKTSKPTWSDTALYFMILVVITIVLGSMWIMANLDYHHGSGNQQQINKEIIEDEVLPSHTSPSM